MTHALAEKACLATLKISVWSGRRLDRKVTDETNEAHNAAPDAGRYNKLLLHPDAFKGITAVCSKARTVFYARTLPWADSGSRILSAVGYDAFCNTFLDIEREFAVEADLFATLYPGHVERARDRLNGMFNASDYPDAGDIRDLFRFRIRKSGIPSSEDFRLAIGDADLERERQRMATDLQETMRDAMRDVFERVAESVGAMSEKLAAFKPHSGTKGDKSEGIFRDSLVNNVSALIELLPSLNVTGDPRLAALADSMKPLVQHSAKELREGDALRADVARQAAAISATVADYLA